jgi:hypothetical protein
MRVLVLGATAFVGSLVAQQTQPGYAPVGVAGIERIPGEKGEPYRALRIKFEVMTKGGSCSWWVHVRDSAKHDLAFINGNDHLPKGRATIFFEVSGDILRSQLADGPLSVSGLHLTCGSDGFADMKEWKTPPIVATDFKGVAPDYRFRLEQPSYTVYAGEGVDVVVRISASDSFREYVQLSLTGLPPGATVHNPAPVGAPKGTNGFWIEVASDAVPGRYPFRITGEAGDLKRDVSGELVILPPRTPLFSAPPVKAPAPPLPIASIPKEMLEGVPRFSVETTLYHINAVLVMQRSNSMRGPRCDAMKQLAAWFSEQFVAERDAFGVVAVRSSAIIASPLSRAFKEESQSAAERIMGLDCSTGNSPALGLELAYQQLQAFDDPSGVNIVVLLLATPPAEISADWPVRTLPDHRNGYPGGPPGCGNSEAECDLPPSTCINQEGWRASFVPTVPSTPMWDPYADPPTPIPVDSGCAMTHKVPGPYFGYNAFHRDIAFIPETDLNGVGFAGDVPLERFSAGPYSGRIRPDSYQNLANAAVNQLVNAADQIRRDVRLKPLVYVIGLAGGSSGLLGTLSPSLLSSFAGEKESHGRAYLARDIEDVPKGFNLIFKDLLRRAQSEPPAP